MPVGLQAKGVVLLGLLLIHAVFSTPIVKRDLSGLSETAIVEGEPAVQGELLGEDVFGGHGSDGSGVREKRLLKLKALGIGAGIAGLKAAGAGVKAVGVAAAKHVGKKAVKAAVTVGATVAKAAITLGIAKLLLSLVFGKINQLIDFKTRLLGGQGGGLLASSNLSGGGSGSANAGGSVGVEASADASVGGDVGVTTEAVSNSYLPPPQDTLPEIDPDKVSLQVPGEIIEGGFNVVNKGAPVVGEVIQRTAERVVRLVGGLTPILGSSVGFKTFKRDTSSEAQFDSSEDLPLEHKNENEKTK